jgi:hypothetical protein
LTLVTKRVSYDFQCSNEIYKLKVCNGNYGDTLWKGLNELATRGGTIFSGTAKMNDYHLPSDKDDDRLYAMCHEIGHCFGLPHWDEDFRNADLGNCMDYTLRPQDNKTPDASNFEFLAELYGTKDGYVSPANTDPGDGTTTMGGPNTSTASTADAAAGGTRGRLSRRAKVEQEHAASPILTDMEWRQLQPIYEQAMREFYANHDEAYAQRKKRRLEDADASMDEENENVYTNSRLLYATDYLESHEIHLTEDIVVQVHFLMA